LCYIIDMTITRARELRLSQTEVEKRLWYRIRGRQLETCKFRRQAVIGRDIVDFACFERQLVIELDGGQHASKIEDDSKRTAWLNSQGYTVLRFWNNDITENVDGVLERIVEELRRLTASVGTPHPNPLPQGERESWRRSS
jgi:very-short-patch-repair endonuclease